MSGPEGYRPRYGRRWPLIAGPGPKGPVEMITERRRLLLGASWTLTATIVALAVGAVLNPVLVFYLHIDGYGIWASATAFASLFGLCGDIGVAGALTKFIAEHRGRNQDIESLAGTALVFGLTAGCAAGVALAILSLF